jgi:hypothetical protein
VGTWRSRLHLCIFPHDYQWQIINGEKYFWTWCLCDCATLEQRCKKPTRCNKFPLLMFLISPTCFGRQIFPSSGALLTVYTVLVHLNAHKVIAGFFLSRDPEVT